MIYGMEYMHKKHGRVLLIGAHPHDGAYLIIERQETTDPDDDDRVLDSCESSDLSPAEGETWPFLGFTSKERSAEQSRAWSARHGFAQIPEGSGLWFYPDGSQVPQDVWQAAWDADYLVAATDEREQFEQACYKHYLARHAAGKTTDHMVPAGPRETLLWRQESGEYGVLLFNAAWWSWQEARKP